MGESDKEVREVMDTPERSKNNQIAASISKFEDSPVFTFLNSLSPIKPVKSTHITQTINPLSFASLPSVFTSPHVTSLRESRFLRRHHLSDPSKPELSSNAQTKIDTEQSNADATKRSGEEQEKVEEDCSKFVVDFPKEDCHRGPYGNEANVEGETEIDQTKEATSCDWDNVISDASELLIFESPDGTDPYKKSLDHGTCFYTQVENDAQNVQSMGTSEQDVEGNEPENLSSQLGEGNETDNTDNCDVIAGPLSNNPGENSDYEHLSGFYRGMRRRCLVFEMGGAHRKNSDENTGSASSLWLQSDSLTASNDHKMVKKKTGNESSCHLLPGIGLHLNALASTPKDYKIFNNDSSASGRLLIGPSLAVNFLPSTTNQEMVSGILPTSSLDIEVGGVENTVLPLEDDIQPSGYAANEEINQNSPKKKRRKAEQGGEGEACKRCNCKRSKCLKLYCECFAAGVYCVEPCACMDCFNKPIHEDTVLATRKQIESRNPLAFAPKVIRGSDSPSDVGDDSSKTPASARHKRGCNCKKSGCLKKYCECYQGGVGCSINCRCEGCRNAFGRKDGMEADAEEDEMDVTEKSRLDRSFQKTTIENELEQNTDSAPPATPLRIGRQSTQIPFSSKKKPPRSSFPSIASISGFHARQSFGKPSFFPPPPPPPPPKFDKQLKTVNEDEMPDFLQGGSPVGGVETSSPNRKRVSPPHGVVTSTGLRSSRKLILQSIPSFPSLTQNQ